MAKLTIPVTVCDDSEAGVWDDTEESTVNTTALSNGVYKIAAVGQPLIWRTVSDPAADTSGSYLAAGDQELILISAADGATVDLNYLRSSDADGDGLINIVPVILLEIPGIDPANYKPLPTG